MAEPDAATVAAAAAIMSAQNATDDEPERWEALRLATVALDAARPHIRAAEQTRICSRILGYAAGRKTVVVSDMLVMCGLTPTLVAATLADGGDPVGESYERGTDG